jgi:hypothetical protein
VARSSLALVNARDLGTADAIGLKIAQALLVRAGKVTG